MIFKEEDMRKIEFKALDPKDMSHRQTFEKLMLPYIAELNEHSERPLPEQYRQKWINSIIDSLGAADRHLELCFLEGSAIGFWFGKVDHVGDKGFIKPGYGYIMEFYVSPEYRRLGIGCGMFGRLEALFAADGAKMMYLTADPVTGRPFWEALGFVRTGEVSSENGLDIYEREVFGGTNEFF